MSSIEDIDDSLSSAAYDIRQGAIFCILDLFDVEEIDQDLETDLEQILIKYQCEIEDLAKVRARHLKFLAHDGGA